MTTIISQFWLDRVAGKPLGRAWAKKDAQIALEHGDFDALPMLAWLNLGDREQRDLLQRALAVEA